MQTFFATDNRFQEGEILRLVEIKNARNSGLAKMYISLYIMQNPDLQSYAFKLIDQHTYHLLRASTPTKIIQTLEVPDSNNNIGQIASFTDPSEQVTLVASLEAAFEIVAHGRTNIHPSLMGTVGNLINSAGDAVRANHLGSSSKNIGEQLMTWFNREVELLNFMNEHIKSPMSLLN